MSNIQQRGAFLRPTFKTLTLEGGQGHSEIALFQGPDELRIPHESAASLWNVSTQS